MYDGRLLQFQLVLIINAVEWGLFVQLGKFVVFEGFCQFYVVVLLHETYRCTRSVKKLPVMGSRETEWIDLEGFVELRGGFVELGGSQIAFVHPIELIEGLPIGQQSGQVAYFLF